MKNLNLLLSLSLIIILFSCSSDIDEEREKSSLNNEHILNESNLISEANYDTVSPGEFHNIIVLEIINNSNVSSNNDIRTNIEEIIDYHERNHSPFTLPYSYEDFSNPRYGLDLLKNNNLASNDLINILEEYYDELMSTNTPAEFLSVIEKMEKSTSDFNLSEEEQKLYRGSLSVLKYSFDLWTAYPNSSNNNIAARGGVNWQIVIMSDWTSCVYSAAVSAGNPVVSLGAAAVGSAGSALWQSVFYQVPANDFHYHTYSPNLTVEW